MKPPPTLEQPQSRWICPVILTIATLIAFGLLGSAEFCSLDDPYNLWQNPRLNPPTFDSVMYYWSHAEYGLYIPLTYTVWGLLALFARVSPDPMGVALNPWVFHCANIAVHVLGVLAVFGILVELLKNQSAACVGALLYALHPVQVEAVAWAAGMKDLLAGMLGMVAIWQYIIFARNPAQRRHYAFATVALIGAMLGKPSAMVVPLMAGAIDLWLLNRNWRKILPGLAPWLALAAGCAVVARVVQTVEGVPAAPLWARPLIAGDTLAFYLYKLVWPISLTIDYGRRPAVVMDGWWLYVAWIIPVGIGVALALSRKRRELAVAGVLFVIGIAPVLGLATFLYQRFSTTADHYLYLAMLGPALAAGWAIQRFHKPLLIAGALVVLLLLGVRTMRQTSVWQNDVALFTNAYEVNPDSVMVLYNLGNIHAQRGRMDLSLRYLLEAANRLPDYPNAPFKDALAGMLTKVGQALLDADRPAEARDAAEASLRIVPGDADAMQLLQSAHDKFGTTPAGATTTTAPSAGE